MRALPLLLTALSLAACAPAATYTVPARRGARASASHGARSSSGGEVIPAGEAFTEDGDASYYSDRLSGNATANGERYDPEALTAAHRTLRFGARVRVRRADGRSVVVCVNDRGPFVDGRVIDLSRAAAEALGMIRAGVVPVTIELVGHSGSRRCE